MIAIRRCDSPEPRAKGTHRPGDRKGERHKSCGPLQNARASLAARSLTVEVWYPAEAGDASQAFRDQPVVGTALPLVIWSHGFMSDRLDHGGLGRFLASHGYVFAAIGYPLSGRGSPGGATTVDVVNQPGDASFVLDTFLGVQPPLDGAVDGEFVAKAGLSLGGLTTALAGMHPAVRDDRFGALIAAAPATCTLGVEVFEGPNPPLLVVHGDSDQILDFDTHARPLGTSAAFLSRVWLAKLIGGTHTGFPDVTAELFDNLDHAFLDAQRGDDDAQRWIDAGIGLQEPDVEMIR